MSEIKHTPLPWKIRTELNLISIGDQHGNWICEFFYALVEDETQYGHPIITKAEALENARLFLAAPELYEACRFHCETRCKMRNLNKNVCKNCLYGKALRKARGESEDAK